MIRHQRDMSAFAISPAECAKRVNVAIALSAHRIATVPTWKAVGVDEVPPSLFRVRGNPQPRQAEQTSSGTRTRSTERWHADDDVHNHHLLVWSALVARVAYHLGYWNGHVTGVDEAATMIPPRPEDEHKQP
jgi:hypothetical protein